MILGKLIHTCAQFPPLQNESTPSIYFVVLLQGLNELIFGNGTASCLITELRKVGWGYPDCVELWGMWRMHAGCHNWGPHISDTWWPIPLGQKASQKKTLSFELHDTSGFCSYKCLNEMFLRTYHRKKQILYKQYNRILYCYYYLYKIKNSEAHSHKALGTTLLYTVLTSKVRLTAGFTYQISIIKT